MRVLRLFVDIRRGEVRRALSLAAAIFILLVAYYLLKASREVLILAAPGSRAELKSYAAGAQGVLLVGLSLGFGVLAAKVRRRTLLTTVTIFFALQLVAFDLLLGASTHQLAIGVAFFIWLGCFNVLIVAQFWAFANDLYTREDGERVFPLITLGASFGGVVGAQLAKPVLRSFGTRHSLLVSGLLLIVSLAITLAIDRGAAGRASAPPIVNASGPKLLRRDVYVQLIVLLVLVKNSVNALGEYALDRRLLETVKRAEIGMFKANYLLETSLFALVLQLFFVPRVMKRLGVGRALAVLPMFLLLGYSTALVMPSLGLMLAIKVGENGTDYSLQKTAEQSLYLVTSRSVKYKAKAIADTVFVRLGDVVAALLVAVMVAVAVSFRGVATVIGALTVLLLLVTAALARRHRQRAATCSPA